MNRLLGKQHIFLLLAGSLAASDVLAAPGPPPMGGPPCWPPPCVPIDGGVVFLLIAGALFGGWKIYSAYTRKKAA